MPAGPDPGFDGGWARPSVRSFAVCNGQRRKYYRTYRWVGSECGWGTAVQRVVCSRGQSLNAGGAGILAEAPDANRIGTQGIRRGHNLTVHGSNMYFAGMSFSTGRKCLTYFPSWRHNAPLPQSCAPTYPANAAVAERGINSLPCRNLLWSIASLVVTYYGS